MAEMLLAHGAAVDPARADGRTPYALALRRGNVATAELLRARGADAKRINPVDEFLGACLAADEAKARALLAADPGLVEHLREEDRHALVVAAADDRRRDSARLMHALGFDLRWEGPWGGTPLHHAAWHGDGPMVRLLLALGAPVDVRDRQFGSSPLGWAAHGSANCRRADDDYRAVVEMLLDAGADRETAINRWGEPPESLSSRRVARLLRTRGLAPPPPPSPR